LALSAGRELELARGDVGDRHEAAQPTALPLLVSVPLPGSVVILTASKLLPGCRSDR
jgi:hypothetical protein